MRPRSPPPPEWRPRGAAVLLGGAEAPPVRPSCVSRERPPPGVSQVTGTVQVVEGQMSSVERRQRGDGGGRGVGGGGGGGGGGDGVELQGALLDVLEEEVPLVLGRLAVLGSDDAGRPVQVEHVDQLLLLLLQLLDLSLQLAVDALQLLRLLREGGGEGVGEINAALRWWSLKLFS